MKRLLLQHHSKESGFTIIELMVATLIFAIIMTILTFSVIAITQTYYKGVTENKTQNVARSVMNTIGQALQFDAGSYSSNYSSATEVGWVCIGSEEFTYQLGSELPASGVSSNNGLIEASQCNSGPNWTGTQLLDPSMRLSQLIITPSATTPGIFTINLTVSYGDDSTLNNPNSDNTNTVPTDSQHGPTTCKGQSGEQFCHVASLSTVVDNRTGA